MSFPSPAAGSPLLTDLYELTMACAYWKSGAAEREAVFHLYFRTLPFKGGFVVAAGLEQALAYLRDFRFRDGDIAWLAALKGADGQELFPAGFLDYLRQLKLRLDIDAVPEGTVVFPQEPLMRVRGSLLEAQIIEPALLNFLNFQSLVATKSARVCLAAGDDPVVEFGLRRAQGVDGALTASRAAYIGGCQSTSNVLAGQMFGIPVKGTHAHSWVLSFENELESFRAYAAALPNNSLFLVDTYDSLEGVRHAVEVGRELRQRGHRLLGIRLDSGDLAYLSIEARKILDEAGFKDAVVLASNDLDEYLVSSLKQQGAAIKVWGVGTRLVTAYDQPALGGVYKLSALREPGGGWRHKLKLSEQAAKITNPGILQVRRFRDDNEFIGDAIYDELLPMPGAFHIVDPVDPTRRKSIDKSSAWEDLLVPVVRSGEGVYAPPALADLRARTQEQLRLLHPGIKRFLNPHRYPAGLEKGLHELKMQLILQARQK